MKCFRQNFWINILDYLVGGDPTVGGIAYGSVYKPVETGAAGGGSHGGLGGGKLKIRVPAEFLLDGFILADGADGELNSGGGSGGSVFIETGGEYK